MINRAPGTMVKTVLRPHRQPVAGVNGSLHKELSGDVHCSYNWVSVNHSEYLKASIATSEGFSRRKFT